MNAPVVLAQLSGSASQPGSSPKNIKVERPQNGQAVTVHLDGSTRIDFSDVTSEKLTFVRVGDKLIVLFDNQSTVTVDPVFNASGHPLPDVAFDMAPDRTLTGEEFASLFPITTDQSVLPAGGTGGNGPTAGAHFGDSTVDPLSVGTPLALLGPGAGQGSNFADLSSEAPPPALTATPDIVSVVEAGVRPANAPFAGTPIATGNVLTNDVAVDLGAVKAVTGVSVGAGSTPTGSNLGATLTGIYGTLVLGADGSFTYTLNNSDTSTNALAQGQHASDVFSYTVSDSLGHNAITTLTIDVIGTNDLPVIASGAESSSLAELINTTGSPTHDTTQPAPTGTLNFTDVDLTDTHSVGVTLQSAAWSGGPNIPAATQADLLAALQTALHDSTNSGAGSIDWTFSIADKDLDFLGQGETLQVTYNVAVADSAGATSNIQTVTITVTGTNDVPVVTAAQATGDAIEGAAAPGPNLVTNGDFETGDFTGWSAGAHSSVDELFVRGLWTADLGPTPQNSESHESLSQHIATTVGATYQITFFAARGVEFDPASIFTVDWNGTPIATLDSGSPLGFTEYTFTVTATGSDTVLSFEYRDNADVWRLDDVSVVATSVPVQRTATGTISFADADLNDTHSVPTVVFKSTTLDGGLGSPLGTLTAAVTHDTTGTGLDGEVTWQFGVNNNDPTVQALGAGDQITEVFTVTIADGHGGQTTQDVAITIHGTNEAPVIAPADKSESDGVTESNLVTGDTSTLHTQTGTIHFSDVDLTDRPSATISAQTATYIAADGHTVLSLSPDEFAAIEQAFTVATAPNSTNNGAVNWTYSIPDSALDFLAAGEKVTLISTVLVDDHNGGTDTATVTVTLTGADDKPVIDAGVTGQLTEQANHTLSLSSDSIPVTVHFSDPDLDNVGHTATVTSVSASGVTNGILPGILGTAELLSFFHINSVIKAADSTDGDINATFSAPDLAFDYLAFGEQLTITYTLKVNDHAGGTDTQTVSVTVTGTNDAPTFVSGPATSHLTEDVHVSPAGILHSQGTLAFADADLSDTHTVSTSLTASSWSGGANPIPDSVLQSALSTTLHDSTGAALGSVGWSFALPDSLVDFLAQGETLTLTYNVIVTDSQFAPTTQTVKVTIQGTNDAPVIGETSVETGAVTEAGDLPGIDEAGVGGALTLTASLSASLASHPMVASELVGLATTPADVHNTLLAIETGLGVNVATAIAIVWQSLDAAYVSAGPNQSNINEAFARLGVEYADYVKAGGVPLVDVVAKFTADNDHDGHPDRDQSLHNNLLGNLTNAALSQHFSGNTVLLNDLTNLISGVDADLLNRPYASGDENSTGVADAHAFDLAHRLVTTATGTLVATGVDHNATQTWSANTTNGTYGTFAIDASTGQWTYTLDDGLAATQALAQGDSPVETFLATVTDDHGATDTVAVKIVVHGSDDAPTDIALDNLSIATFISGTIVANVAVADVDDTSFTFVIRNPDHSVNTDLAVVGSAGRYQLEIVNPAGLGSLPPSVEITATDSSGLSFTKGLPLELPIQLFDSGNHLLGTFATIQSAINVAGDGVGQYILVPAGTYAENLLIDRGVEIRGANADVAGDGTRGAETILTGQSQITTSHKVVINGVEFLDNHDYTLNIADNFVALKVLAGSADGHVIENSVFDRAPVDDPSGFAGHTFVGSALQPTHRGIEIASVAAGTSVTIEHNLFTGDNPYTYAGDSWRSAIYSNGGAGDTNIQNNIFQDVRSGVNADNFSPTVQVDGNNFSHDATAIAVGLGSDVAGVTSIHGNTFANVDTEFNFQNLTTPVSFDATATGNAATAEPILILGGSAGDTLTAGQGNDTIDGGGGINTLIGGIGNDIYYAHAHDTIIENPNQGTDEVRTPDSFTLPANVENLTLLDSAPGPSNLQDFNAMPLGPITNGENGWQVLAGGRDQSVVDLGGGNHAFQMSSDPSVPDFAGPYSPALSAAAGEPDTGAPFNGESISFVFKAVNPTPDGSRLEIDFGNAAGTDRNNFLVLESFPTTGIRIAVSEPDLSGNFTGDGIDPAPNDWRQLTSNVDPTVAHTLEMRLTYVDGPNNDRIELYLDGQYIGTTTTFENYHDALGGTHIANETDRVFFRPSANGAPQDGRAGRTRASSSMP